MDIVRIILAILLPPLGVFLQEGLKGQFWINIVLTILGYIPGIVNAVWIIARRSGSEDRVLQRRHIEQSFGDEGARGRSSSLASWIFAE